jgi:hypothetical protein
MASNDSKFEKAQSDFQALSVVASSLNSASDELSRAVAVLDEALKKLNLGLTVWVIFESHSIEPWQFDDEQIGYSKVNGKWGIALQRVWGDTREGDFDEEGPWLFNEAPREMRLKSVDKIPKLIEALSKAAFEMTEKVKEKTRGVRELAGVIEQIASAGSGGLKPPPRPSDAYAKHVRLIAEQAKSPVPATPPKQSAGLPPPPIPAIAAEQTPTLSDMGNLASLASLLGKKKEGGK